MLSEKIVVVDDDPRVIKSIKLMLKKYEIKSFLDSNEALEFFKMPRDIKLVLLDFMMPGIDGISLLKEIKRYNMHVSVIIMTAFGNKDVVVEALRSHADDFIEKPFNFQELEERIEIILREKRYYAVSSQDAEDKVERIKSFLKRNYKQATLDIVAEEMCLSSKYVSRMFRKKGGNSFRDFKIKIKIDKAKVMLKDTAFSVSEIAWQLGYKNPESFMRTFKNVTTYTPLEYRKKVQENNPSK